VRQVRTVPVLDAVGFSSWGESVVASVSYLVVLEPAS
jgi:hypothetical protein